MLEPDGSRGGVCLMIVNCYNTQLELFMPSRDPYRIRLRKAIDHGLNVIMFRVTRDSYKLILGI